MIKLETILTTSDIRFLQSAYRNAMMKAKMNYSMFAWRVGYIDCIKGICINPYHKDTDEYCTWSRGWDHASLERTDWNNL